MTDPRILVVEDAPAVRTVMVRHLSAIKFQVDQAATVAEALARLDSADILILDLKLNGDAQPVIDQWKRIKPNSPILILSGYLTSVRILDLLGQGVHDVLAKPASAQALNTILARYRMWCNMMEALNRCDILDRKIRRLQLMVLITSTAAVTISLTQDLAPDVLSGLISLWRLIGG